MDLVKFIVKESTKLFNGQDYHVGEKAAGNCYDASEAMFTMCMRNIGRGRLIDDLRQAHRIDVVCAEHPKYVECDEDAIDLAELTAIGFINHFALVVDSLTIIDYTLRQFDETSPYPFVGTRSEWETRIAKRWNAVPLVSITEV